MGKKINKPTKPLKFFVTYKNKTTGEEKEYLTPNYPWNDSVWMSQWTFKSQRTEDPEKGQAMSLRVEDERGSDITASIVDNPDIQFILVAYDLSKTDKAAFHRLLPFIKSAEADGYSFICLTSSLQDEIAKFRMNNGLNFSFYNADDVVLKTMVRSNPGLLLIRDGVILAKWPSRNFPSYTEVMEQFRKP